METVPILIVDFRTGQEELAFASRRSVQRPYIYPTVNGDLKKVEVPCSDAAGYFLRHYGGREMQLIAMDEYKLRRIMDHKMRKDMLLRSLSSSARTRRTKHFKHRLSRLAC